MPENLIKSADRVKNHGEVFTPQRIVKLMLDQPEITAKINDLQATFLEPAAGEGAFLVALLKRKLAVALRQSSNAHQYGVHSLMALASLYGIELLEDNVEALVMNLNDTFRDTYRAQVKQAYGQQPSNRILKSAQVIIRANIAQGDALTQTTSTGEPIIFSEWQPVQGRKNDVQRTEYTLAAIMDGSGPTGSVQGASQQLDLFADFDDLAAPQPTVKSVQYAVCQWDEIYQERLSDVTS